MTNKRLTAFIIGSTLASLWIAQTGVARAAETDETEFGGFVTVEGNKLKLNGGDFYFSGVNSYSIVYSEAEAEEQFEILSDMGANVLRFWGFWNGEDLNPQLDEEGNIVRNGTPDTDIYGRYVLQARPGVYPEPAWRRLDYAIYLAHVYGIKLIIPLMNQWPEFGGLDTVLRWAGVKFDLPDHSEGHYLWENAIKEYRDLYWDSVNDDNWPPTEMEDGKKKEDVSKECQQIYMDYVTHMLNRVNTYTGLAYKDDPAIMIWEIFNEPRFGPWGGDGRGEKVLGFLKRAAAHIKSIDKNHLVATGEEGFMRMGENEAGGEGVARLTYPWNCGTGEGIDFRQTAELEDIDVLSIHSWPFQWNLWETSQENINVDKSTTKEYSDEDGNVLFEKFAREWIEEHVRIATEEISTPKPVYLGEFGYQILRAGDSTLALRNSIFQETYDTAKDVELAGATVFNILASHDVESAVYTVPEEEWTRAKTLMGLIDDQVIPHDLDYKFDVYCPEDEETCAIIREFSDYQADRIENPDPPYVPPCLDPETRCDGECVFLDSHPDHCGKCGNACEADETCLEGECTALFEGAGVDEDVEYGCSVASAGSRAAGVTALVSALLF